MKVVVRGEVYSSDDEVLVVILTDKDKELIGAMPRGVKKYAAFPDHGKPMMEVLRALEKD